MRIKFANEDHQGKRSAMGVMSSKILRQAKKLEALKWAFRDEIDSPRQRPSAHPAPQTKERLVFSIKRHDGSDVLSIYT